MTSSPPNVDQLLDDIFASTPLLFIRRYLRDLKEQVRGVRIGTTQSEMRANLRDAIVSSRTGVADVEAWLHAVEGWGRQHLYLGRVSKRSLNHAHLLNETAFRAFLKRKKLLADDRTDLSREAHVLDGVNVDDELARISWRVFGNVLKRRKDLDEVRETDEGDFEYHAFERQLRRSASQLIVRKTDGIVLQLIDVPLGDEHDAFRGEIRRAAGIVLDPLRLEVVSLAPIVSALDEGAVSSSGPRARRPLALGVQPTQTRYAADGARLEFKSTRQSAGYTSCDAVRHVRRAMQISRFEGETGKFRLSFVSQDHGHHDMVISLSAADDRIFLFSRMDETEVLSLVDRLIAL